MPSLLTRAVTYPLQALARILRTQPTLGRPSNIYFGINRPGTLDIEGQAPESLPSVYGVCALLADALVSLDWWITKPAVNGGRELVVDNAAAAALAAWPKWSRWAWCWNALIAGNGLAHIARNAEGEPRALEVYPAGRGWINLYDDNSLQYALAPMNGESFEASEADVGHLRYRPCGLDPRVGISPLVSASPTITMLLATRAGTTQTQIAACRPSGFLHTDGKLDRGRAEEIRQRWQDAHGAPGERGKTPVLEFGLKYETIDPTDLVKLATIETASLGTAEICRLFGVPASLLETEGSGARASAVEDRRRLGAFCTSPLARLIEDALGSTLLSQRQRDMGLQVTVDTSASLIGEGAEMSDTLSKLANAGILTPNECRAWLAYGSAGAEADFLRAPVNTWSLQNWAKAMPSSTDQTIQESQAASALRMIRGGKSS